MSADTNVLVSVVIPTFNRARYLPDALDSVARQGVEGIETIVVDDGSTDETEAVVAAYGSAVRYVRQPHHGAAAARNTGVALATGRFISFLDSDDIWMPAKTRRSSPSSPRTLPLTRSSRTASAGGRTRWCARRGWPIVGSSPRTRRRCRSSRFST